MRARNIKYKVLLGHSFMPEDISGMKECKIPAWTREKMFWHQQGTFFSFTTEIFLRRASF
jgi:hypothetical protein